MSIRRRSIAAMAAAAVLFSAALPSASADDNDGFQLLRRDKDGGFSLGLHIDREMLASARRSFKKRLRGWVARSTGRSEAMKRFRLELDKDWEKTPLDRRLVLLVHGYQSTPERHGSILDDIRKLGLPCGMLRYPNDQPIDDSAALLSLELKKVKAVQPRRQITLLTLSMGGLVSRAIVEDPKLDPGNVQQLILVATPNHGSNLARIMVGGTADVFEFLFRATEPDLWERTLARYEDGLGEASHDLRPGSTFLKTLNARQRNPRVRYTLFLGTGGPLSGKTVERLREIVREQGDRNRITRLLAKKALELLEDIDEVIAGRGDGAVALTRGRLAGVDDMVELEFAHRKLMDGESEGSRRLREEILRRIRP